MVIIAYVLLLLLTIGIATFVFYTAYAIISAAPYVPTFMENVERMMNIAKLRSGETLMDLGSGDGRILRAAAKRGAASVGIEINPILYWWSKFRNRLSGFRRISVLRENLWQTDLSGADVLTLFFIAPKMEKLKEKILREMKPGARVVSYGFRFPDWQYVERDDKVYLYVVKSELLTPNSKIYDD